MTPCERTKFLIAWWDRLAPIVNGEMQANRDLCRDLAQFCGELGNDNPSEYAIGVAQEWERMIQHREKPWLAEVSGPRKHRSGKRPPRSGVTRIL